VKGRSFLLCVDDEPLNQQILVDFLEDEYELKTVDNGQACLDSVREDKPDLILLDINMPVMSGIEVCQRLKADENTKDIPIIMVTALATKEEREAGLAANCDAYITKPFDFDLLLTTIRGALNNET